MRILILLVLVATVVHAYPRKREADSRKIDESVDSEEKSSTEENNSVEELVREIKAFGKQISDMKEDDKNSDSNSKEDSKEENGFLAIFAIFKDPKTHLPVVIAEQVPLDVEDIKSILDLESRHEPIPDVLVSELKSLGPDPEPHEPPMPQPEQPVLQPQPIALHPESRMPETEFSLPESEPQSHQPEPVRQRQPQWEQPEPPRRQRHL